MRARAVTVHNFRCLHDVRVDLDDVTTLIGPNGAGKSTLLRALDWFFNGAALSDADLSVGASQDRQIWVEVEFDQLTETDRDILGPQYASEGTGAFIARRIWENGASKLTGKARAYAPFEEVRRLTSAGDIKEAFGKLRVDDPNLTDLPTVATRNAIETAMRDWEMEHLDLLTDAYVAVTHLQGIAGEGSLGKLFSFVLVSADHRASEEGIDGKKTIFGRILERTLDRAAVNDALSDLADELRERQEEITATFLGPGLRDVENLLNAELHPFAVGRTVQLGSEPITATPRPAVVNLTVVDQGLQTGIEQQGHGFQRALIIGLLKTLAQQGKATDADPTIMLAIEEPELFQHPTQARVFARVLREVAQDQAKRIQVAYATHSPYFIEAAWFDQVRRVTRSVPESGGVPTVRVGRASVAQVTSVLAAAGFNADAVQQRWEQVSTAGLAEALFAAAVIVVEGTTDRGVLMGIASREGQVPLDADGVAVASAGAKEGVPILHAILQALGVPTLVVFDNDRNVGDRARQKWNQKKKDDPTIDVDAKVQQAHADEVARNRKLLTYFGLPQEDFPSGVLSDAVCVWEDTVEAQLDADWPTWAATRSELVAAGRGAPKKNEATYALAARECPEEPGASFLAVLAAARAMVS